LPLLCPEPFFFLLTLLFLLAFIIFVLLQKIFLWPIVLIILALDWGALHDILKGEPNPYLEYGVLILSIFVFGRILWYKMKIWKK